MAIERERKFLVDHNLLPKEVYQNGYVVEAGYFTQGPTAIRVTKRWGDVGKICLKQGMGQERLEFEYLIPLEDAEEMIKLSPTHLIKTRYEYEGWKIDHFSNLPTSLWTAEWEEHQNKKEIPSPLPNWIYKEVTDLPMFTNQALAWTHGLRK